MSDEKKPIDPVVKRMLGALAKLPDQPDPDPAAAPPPKKKKGRRKDPRLTIRWHFTQPTSPTDPESPAPSTNPE